MDRLTECSTGELVAACQSGDQAAWFEFVGRFNRRVTLFVLREYRTCCEARGDVCDVVRDLTNEVYLRLVANGCGALRDFGREGDHVLLAYLARTARAVVLDHARRRSPGTGGRPTTLDGEPPAYGLASGPPA
jgi:DNA-directed RNA polymerase specialized sigma24 family protein